MNWPELFATVVLDIGLSTASAIQANVTCDSAGTFDTNTFSELMKMLSENC